MADIYCSSNSADALRIYSLRSAMIDIIGVLSEKKEDMVSGSLLCKTSMQMAELDSRMAVIQGE